MSEQEATSIIQEPTLEQQRQALQREVEHVTEQMKVEHVQITYWKQRAVKAEHALEGTQKELDVLKGKRGMPTKAQASDGLHGQPEPMDSLL